MEKIRKVTLHDAPAVAAIYNYYILNTVATFETVPVTAGAMQARICEIAARYPYFVYENEAGELLGYCYINTWKNKEAYRDTLETTFYVKPGHTGKEIGKKLMEALLASVRDTSVHSLIACISLPNDASIRLHARFGFEKAAHFREAGRKFGRRIDVEEWQWLKPETE
ncbi:MAG: N-acetyltransferase family protein [Parabacteroides sp.]|nr:N-acetyltransferase family protein [Parabacteroides sp.]